MEIRQSKIFIVLFCALALAVGFLLAQTNMAKSLLSGPKLAPVVCPTKEEQLAACPKADCSVTVEAIRARLLASPEIPFSGKVLAEIKEVNVGGLTVSYDSQKAFPLDEGVVEKSVSVDASTLVSKYTTETLTRPVTPSNPKGGAAPKVNVPTNAPESPNEKFVFPPAGFVSSPISLSGLKAGDKVIIVGSNDFRKDSSIIASGIVLVSGLSDEAVNNLIRDVSLFPSTPLPGVTNVVPDVPNDNDDPNPKASTTN